MFKFLGAILMTGLISTTTLANQTGDITFPFPDKLYKSTLMHAINMRKSTKSFLDKEIDDKTLGTLLWAAYGVNRSTGERTIPTAMNKKDLDIYVARKDGTFKYDADNHKLKRLSTEDIRPLFNTQEYMANVPVVLIYTGSMEDYAVMHAGSAYQNVALFTVAANLGNVVRGYFDKEAVKNKLSLSKESRVIISQAIGYKAD